MKTVLLDHSLLGSTEYSNRQTNKRYESELEV
jgi:hypothetical protein